MSSFRNSGYFILSIMLIIIILFTGCEKSQNLIPKLTEESITLPMNEQTPIPLQLQNETTHYVTPLFKHPWETDLSSEDFVVMTYYEQGVALPTNSHDNEWLAVESGHGTTYIPRWYWTDSASKAEVTTPVHLQVDADAMIYLYPDSQISWSYSQLANITASKGGTLPSENKILSLFRHDEWYGIIFSPYPKYDDYVLHRPVLLWLHGSDSKKTGESYRNLLSSGLELPIDTIREISEVRLLKGTKQEAVKQLLGEPHFIEASRNLNSSSESMRVGEVWRYEHPEAHFTVTMYEDVIEEWQWSLPITEEEQIKVGSDQYPYGYKYHFRFYPLVPSIEPEIEWQNQGEIAYAYLWEGTDEVLLLRGNDGLFSGMHYFSNIYAVDRQTGAKLWQIDAGHAGADAVLTANKQYVSILTRYF